MHANNHIGRGWVLFLVLFAAPAFVMSLSRSARDQQWCGSSTILLSPTSSQHPNGALIPWLECVTTAPGTITAYFGFDNPSTAAITIAVGTENQFVPAPINRSQTTQFLPGRSRYFPMYAFSVNFINTDTATWQLNGYEVVANSTSKVCQTMWMRFEMTVTQAAPTDAQLAAVVQSAATEMGVEQSQITTNVVVLGLNEWQIQFNVSQPTTNGGVTPYVGITKLFGDNTKFSAFVNASIDAGLVPSDVNTMPSGLELEGWPIPSAPGVTPPPPTTGSHPQAPTTPTPVSPTNPSSLSPESTTIPDAPAPTSAANAVRPFGLTHNDFSVFTLGLLLITIIVLSQWCPF